MQCGAVQKAAGGAGAQAEPARERVSAHRENWETSGHMTTGVTTGGAQGGRPTTTKCKQMHNSKPAAAFQADS